MKRRTIFSAIGSFLLSLIGFFSPSGSYKARRPALGAKRTAPAPPDAPWRHYDPPVPVSSQDAQLYSAVARDPHTGFHEYLEAQVVCELKHPAKSKPVDLGDYPSYRTAMRAAGAIVPDAEVRNYGNGLLVPDGASKKES